jgi:type IV pilus assembly protein PilC
LRESGIFDAMVIGMIDVGEETGTLAEMMLRVSDTYDDEVDTAVEGLTSLLEPLLIVFLALIVGTIVVAMFLPLLSLMKGMGQTMG